MLTEKDMEDAIAANPEKYIEEELTLISRQYRIGKYIFDLLFEDRHGSKLIVELQKGTLDRNHTYKILDYFDEYKDKNPEDFVELMVIANKIPRERRDRLSSYGISFKEISESEFPKKTRQIPESNAAKTQIDNIQNKSNFSHPQNVSPRWDSQALDNVEEWLKKHINGLPIGERIKVGDTAKLTRNVAHIMPEGNIEGVRYLLWRLHEKSYIDLPDNLHFVVRKKIEE